MKIVFTGANTRGEIFSTIALVDKLREIYLLREENLQFYYLGSIQTFTSQVFNPKGIKLKDVYINEEWGGKMGFLFDVLIKIPFGLPFTVVQSFFQLLVLRPKMVFSKGGYDSMPVCIAAWMLRIPIFIHESNAIPTRTNIVIKRFAAKIFISYHKTAMLLFPPKTNKNKFLAQTKIVFTGVPLRDKFLEKLPAETLKERAIMTLGLSFDRPIILFLNESSPAIEDEKINNLVLDILPELLSNFEVIHQSGRDYYENVRKEAAIFLSTKIRRYYHLYSFLDEERLRCAYSAADLIVARGGANTIFEIAMMAKPSIIIPLFHTKSRYQITNAYLYSYQNPLSSLVIEEINFLPHFLLETIKDLINDKEELKQMSNNAKQFAQPEATQKIAQAILNFFAKKFIP